MPTENKLVEGVFSMKQKPEMAAKLTDAQVKHTDPPDTLFDAGAAIGSRKEGNDDHAHINRNSRPLAPGGPP
jgi:hypothetical protein